MGFERFKKMYPQFSEIIKNAIYQEIYDYLSKPKNIWAMIQASEKNKPALSGMVENLEEAFENRFDFYDHTNRHIIGCMIKEIILDFGYRNKGQGLVGSSRYFKTAARYELDKAKASKELVPAFEIISLKSENKENTPDEDSDAPTVDSDFEFEDFLHRTGKYKDLRLSISNNTANANDKNKCSTCRINRAGDARQKDSIDKVTRITEKLRGISVEWCRDVAEAIPILKNALYSRNPSAREEAARTLAQIACQGDFFTATSDIASDIIAVFVELLQDEDQNLRLLAAETIGQLGAPGAVEAVPSLIQALRDEDAYVREKAAWALGEIGPVAADAAPALIEALDDEDEFVRDRAGWALGMLGPNGGVDALMQVLQTGESHAKKIAARELGEIAPYAAGNAELALIKALHGGDPGLRATAAWSLGSILKVAAAWPAGSVAIPEGEIIAALLESLQDESSSVREKAAWALGNLKNATPGVISALLDALRAEGSGIRRAAAWALGNIAPQEDEVVLALVEALGEQCRYVREKSAWALGRVGRNSSSAVPALVKTLNDEDWGVRKAAVLSLGRIGSAAVEAVPALVQVIEDNKENEIVRKYAAWATVQIGEQLPEKLFKGS